MIRALKKKSFEDEAACPGPGEQTRLDQDRLQELQKQCPSLLTALLENHSELARDPAKWHTPPMRNVSSQTHPGYSGFPVQAGVADPLFGMPTTAAALVRSDPLFARCHHCYSENASADG